MCQSGYKIARRHHGYSHRRNGLQGLFNINTNYIIIVLFKRADYTILTTQEEGRLSVSLALYKYLERVRGEENAYGLVYSNRSLTLGRPFTQQIECFPVYYLYVYRNSLQMN